MGMTRETLNPVFLDLVRKALFPDGRCMCNHRQQNMANVASGGYSPPPNARHHRRPALISPMSRNRESINRTCALLRAQLKLKPYNGWKAERFEPTAHDSLEDFFESSQGRSAITKNPNPKSLYGDSQVHAGMFEGEFGWEIGLGLQVANTYAECGLLGSTRSCGKLSSLYLVFSPEHTDLQDCHRVPGVEYFLGGSTHMVLAGTRRQALKENIIGGSRALHKVEWVAPDLLGAFQRLNNQSNDDVLPLTSGQALLVIINKYEDEWDAGPQNYLSVPLLKSVVTLFSQVCKGGHTVYSRNIVSQMAKAGMRGDGQDDSDLVDPETSKLDTEVLQSLRGTDSEPISVTIMQDLIDHYSDHIDANELQARVFAKSQCFVDVQGGLMKLASYFGGRHVVYQVAGRETYKYGFQKLGGAKYFVKMGMTRETLNPVFLDLVRKALFPDGRCMCNHRQQSFSPSENESMMLDSEQH